MAFVDVGLNDHVLTISLNRPDRKNAINSGIVEQIALAFDRAIEDSEVRVVLLRGEGADFSAGGDLSDLDAMLDPDSKARSATFRGIARALTRRLFVTMDRVPQPILVAARGHVIGAGVQMAAVADLVIASETARFSLPNVCLAHITDHGETWHVRRKIGPSRFMQMALLGDRVDAASAEKFGLINYLVDDASLDEEAAMLAGRIAALPPVAARQMKQLIVAGPAESFDAQLSREEEALGRAVEAEDFVEAIRAFAEKRRPVFTGR